MQWLYVLLLVVAQISAIAAIGEFHYHRLELCRQTSFAQLPNCPTMDAGLRGKIMDRHRKYQPAARGDFEIPEYDCDLEKIAKDYLDDPAYLLGSQYGLIKGLGRRGSTIDQQLDEAFKSLEWRMLKEAAEGRQGLEPLIPQHYGCYYSNTTAIWSVVACVYDERIWRSD